MFPDSALLQRIALATSAQLACGQKYCYNSVLNGTALCYVHDLDTVQ
jgi:hypothetical protein